MRNMTDKTNKTIAKYNPQEIEQKWQAVWEEEKIFSPDVSAASVSNSDEPSKPPFYNLMMFPYPSAEGLHVGNMYAFTGADVYARYNRMLGKDVFEPIGLDGFGIHSENYALKIGRHPKEQAQIAEKNFYRQLRSIGNSFDWQRTLETYDPDYYKWTQWLFIQLFKVGLAYRDTALVNWCPKDLTVLSDEQVIEGSCERCGKKVEKKNLEQWFFRITEYADRLLNNIKGLNWTEKVKIAQKNWIGKSEGAEVEFKIKNSELGIMVFTTRPDTLFGATFMVLSPEYDGLKEILKHSPDSEAGIQDHSTKKGVREYIEKAKNKAEIERTEEGKEKTGIFSGLYALNPVNGKDIPIWIADYVLAGYGTGAIMAVPAHDKRDFAFAKKYELEIVEVIKDASIIKYQALHKKEETTNTKYVMPYTDLTEAYEGSGRLINSGEWDGWEMPKDMGKVLSWLEEKDLGTRKANFHLRDWLISRQRYWGPPIPMIYCKSCHDSGKSWFSENQNEIDSNKLSSTKYQVLSEEKIHNTKYAISNADMGGWYPVPEVQLPVLLPDVADWKPIGIVSAGSGQAKGPLANHPEFYKTTCPNCGGDATRETDVSDTFLDSAWYFLRYPSVGIRKKEDRRQETRNGHDQELKIGNLKLELPWDSEITRRWLPINQYIGGAEHSVLHLLYSRFVTMALYDLKYLEFEEPFTNFFAHGLIIKDGAKMSKSKGNVVIPDVYIEKYGSDTLRCYLMFIGPYSDGGDFRDSGIEGMFRFLRKVWRLFSETQISIDEFPISDERIRIMHKTIQGVTKDTSAFGYNTAIAKLMTWYNYLSQELKSNNKELSQQEIEVFLKLLAPFAPHMTEELWQKMNHESRSKNHKEEQSNDHNSSFVIHNSIHLSQWPKHEEKYLLSDTLIIPVSINGKRRAEIEVSSQQLEVSSQIETLAKEAVSKHLEGVEVKKVIYVYGKIVNIVV